MNTNLVLDSQTDLRAKAIEAFEAVQKNKEIYAGKEKDDRSQKASAAFVKWFGIEPDRVDGHLITSGDVQLSFIPESWSADFGTQYEGWHVIGLCSRCGENTFSPWCGDLEGIGQYLKEFQPDWLHQCQTRETISEKQPTLEEQLIATMRELIREELAVVHNA